MRRPAYLLLAAEEGAWEVRWTDPAVCRTWEAAAFSAQTSLPRHYPLYTGMDTKRVLIF